MRTKKDFQKLNFNEYAFFKGISTTDAKWEFANLLFPKDWMVEEEYFTKSGTPKINTNDLVESSKLDFTIKSNSHLEGKSQLDYLCDFYNKPIPLNTLRQYSENKAFVKALKFTGKYQVINEILNSEQLLKIQKTWLLSNTYMVKIWSDNTIKFIENTDWAYGFLDVNMIEKETIENQIESYYQAKNKKVKA